MDPMPYPEPGDLVWIDHRVAYIERDRPHWFRVAYVEAATRPELVGWVFMTGYPLTQWGTQPRSIRFVSLKGLIIRRPV